MEENKDLVIQSEAVFTSFEGQLSYTILKEKEQETAFYDLSIKVKQRDF